MWRPPPRVGPLLWKSPAAGSADPPLLSFGVSRLAPRSTSIVGPEYGSRCTFCGLLHACRRKSCQQRCVGSFSVQLTIVCYLATPPTNFSTSGACSRHMNIHHWIFMRQSHYTIGEKLWAKSQDTSMKIWENRSLARSAVGLGVVYEVRLVQQLLYLTTQFCGEFSPRSPISWVLYMEMRSVISMQAK